MGGGISAIAAAVVAGAMALSGCAPSPFTTSTVSTGADGMRTFTWSSTVLCTLSAATQPVEGALHGQQGGREPLWLEDAGGRHLSVVWPAGFTAAFAPDAQLRDDTGALVARERDVVTLGQTNTNEATGSFDDPYVARGAWRPGHCYAYVPAPSPTTPG